MTKEKLTRRNFLMGAGATALVAGGTAVLGGCSSEEPKASAIDDVSTPLASPDVAASELTGWTGTPAEILALGGSTMPLADLNKYRQEYIDTQTDYTCEDGTVIPAVFVKVRSLIHTYGVGCGNTLDDRVFDSILESFSEEDAQLFIDMPMGEKFLVLDLHEKTGRLFDECAEVCERLAWDGFLCRFESNSGTYYNHVPHFQGVVEYQMRRIVDNPTTHNVGVASMTDFLPNSHQDSGTPVFYSIPCDASVVSDGTVLPYDDIEKIFKDKKTLAIQPCYCRYMTLAKAGTEPDLPTWEEFASGQFDDYVPSLFNLRVETCLLTGDEADYGIYKGTAREITEEEAMGFIHRAVEEGYVIHANFSKNSGTICSCHADCCGIYKQWTALGGKAEVEASKTFDQQSHYNLEVDAQSCTGCGECATRCPLHAISMDSGAPVIENICFRCGQCAYVCPQEARKLVLRPENELLEMPIDIHDDSNMKAAYRFETGAIF